jgi:hypothetical protein
MKLLILTLVFAATALAQSSGKEPMTHHAKGTFDVKITPNGTQQGDPGLSKLTVEKTFHGDLEGTSRGEMLTGDSDRKDSGVYVLIERVTGTLNGRKGTFILHHNGVMTRGTPQLSILIAPDSGTGKLVGISGRFNLDIKDGKHLYDLEYTLPTTK